MRWLFLSLCCLVAAPVWAQATPDPLQWLQRVATSAERLNYSGVFVYRSGGNTETSRIAHFADGDHEFEHIEMLDGSPREVVRDRDEVKCYLPEYRLVVVEHRNARRAFPAMLPAGLAGLTDFYVFRKGVAGRVAGHETQAIVVEPRDELRYGRQFWVDTASGLLLKASLIDDKGETRENFSFTEVKIGIPLDREQIRNGAKPQGSDWRVQNVRSVEFKPDESPWVFRNMLPGFRVVSGMRRQVRPDAPEVTHMMLTDGLGAISVFIEPQVAGKARAEGGVFSMGALNVYRRPLGEFQLMVMGDVPMLALKRLGDGLEARRK
ncbi:MAG TPA: MucB/RseB C-terminal domain-containing protein [Rhodocyclaceae bacterium]